MKTKPIFVFGGLIVLLYFGSILVRSYQWEKAAENYTEEALFDIAKPWDTEKLKKRATWGFLEKAKLKPTDITRLAIDSLGSLDEIIDAPECNIQQGLDSYSDEKHTYAICVTKARFEKSTVDMTIRLQDDGDWKNGGWKINNFVSISPRRTQ